MPVAELKETSSLSSFEVNLSATESALTLIPHYRPFPHYHHKTFKVEMIRFLCFVVFSLFNYFG